MPSPRFSRAWLCFGLAVSWIGLCCSGCGTQSDDSDTAGLEKVTLGLNWYPEAEHGGYYAAAVSGLYSEQELDVEVLPGGPNAPILQQVARGDVKFGVTNADQLLLARAQGAPLVAVMAPLQISPRCIMVHEKSGIRSFDQLQDMTIAMSAGAAWAEFLRQRVEFKNVTFVPPGSVARFLSDPDFAQQAYVFSEPFVASSQGGDPHCLMVSDLGFNPYTSVLFCHEETVRDSPELVQAMVTASIAGWKQYLDQPDIANAHIQKLNPEMSGEILKFGAEAMRPLCLTDEPLGAMADERWQALLDQMVACGVLEADRVEMKAAYTLRFLRHSTGGPTAAGSDHSRHSVERQLADR